MSISKGELRNKFSNEFKKYYPIKFFEKYGFKRYKCKKCGSYFWSLKKRDICSDVSCLEEYRFIGEKRESNYDYWGVWEEFKKYFEEKGHKVLDSYPVVCRWRNDLYFTIASIVDFQRYTEDKLVFEYPYDKLIVPQKCLRFNDIENVGITGRHFTCFQMNGQHAFNYPKEGYWKEECLEYIYNFLIKFLDPEELVFKEDVWAMPDFSAFGPCIECFYKGLEIVNAVFIEFTSPDLKTINELDMKVIDVGWGHERLVWVLSGKETSYEAVFGSIFKKYLKFEYDEEFFKEFSKYCGLLDIDDENYEKNLEKISEKLGLNIEEIKKKISVFSAYCSILDHLRSFSYALSDGLLPSNVGGGYNIRLILRRAFYLNQKYNFNFDFLEIIKEISYYFRINLDFDFAKKILELEKQKYEKTLEKGEKEVLRIIKKYNGNIPIEELKVLYESKGISPEMIFEIAEKNNLSVKLPDNYYIIFNQEVKKKQKNIENLPIYNVEHVLYSEVYEFKAKILDILEKNGNKIIILDKTYFYPEKGGEVSDKGKIGDLDVIKVIKNKNCVYHFVEGDISKYKIGEIVECKVDPEIRLKKSCNHTGVHILNGICKKILGKHVWQNGSYVDENKGRLDITHYEIPDEITIKLIEKECNKVIKSKINIIFEILDRKIAEEKYGFEIYQGGAVPLDKLRIVKITDVDIEACGGNHVKNTGDLNYLKIENVEKIHDGVIRFSIVTYDFEKLFEAYDKLTKLKKKFNTNDLEGYINKLIEKIKNQNKEIEKLKKKSVSVDLGSNIVFLEDADMKEIQGVLEQLEKKYDCAIVISSKGLVGGFGEKYRDLIFEIAKELGGRAGGKRFIFGGGPKKERVKEIYERLKKQNI